jgi:hypothetical protein
MIDELYIRRLNLDGYKERIFIDKTEIVCGVNGHYGHKSQFKESDIIEVSFSAMEVKKLLGNKRRKCSHQGQEQQFPYVITKKRWTEVWGKL